MTQPTVVMKPTEVLLNNLFKTVLLAVCFCLSTSSILSAERFVNLHIKNDTSKTFTMPTDGEFYKLTSAFNDYTPDGNNRLYNVGAMDWLDQYVGKRELSYLDFKVHSGEKCTLVGYKIYDKTTANANWQGSNLRIVVDWENLDSNDSLQVNNSVHGPCKLTISLSSALYRANKSYYNSWYGGGETYTFPRDSADYGYGSVVYVPTEAYINLKIEGTPTDTSVGSTVGGGTSSSASGKNYVTVIPENSPTDVRIVLEQSTDLINWTSANQGVFSPSTSRRFFRVRAEEE